MNPNQVFKNRTARLVREASTPAYTTETGVLSPAQRDRLVRAEQALCTEDYCFVCSRATDHFGEHSDAQLLRAYGGK